jgi:hypothetical protein
MAEFNQDEEYAALYREMVGRVDVRKLEHCLLCREPMYLIYARKDGKRTREYCWHCEQGMIAKTETSKAALMVAS